MLNPEDRHAIEDLFERLNDVAGRTGPRDVDAEALIREKIASLPAAPYYMAQTILVQETALREARERIAVLEERLEDEGRARGPWDREGRQERTGGGFLAGAAQTALGVTGGFLLGSAIAGLFTGDAHAEEPAAAEPEPAAEPESSEEGGDWGDGDWGDFDIGGGF